MAAHMMLPIADFTSDDQPGRQFFLERYFNEPIDLTNGIYRRSFCHLTSATFTNLSRFR